MNINIQDKYIFKGFFVQHEACYPSLTLGALYWSVDFLASNDGLKNCCHPSSTLTLHCQRAETRSIMLRFYMLKLLICKVQSPMITALPKWEGISKFVWRMVEIEFTLQNTSLTMKKKVSLWSCGEDTAF